MKLYISGPMSGIEGHNFPAFNAAAAKVRALGYDVVNPVDINPDATLSWKQCLRKDLRELCDCDGIVLLPGWERSEGANLELHVAHRLGLEVFFIGTLREAT